MNATDLQIWNNAAFDNGECEVSSTIRGSWCPIKPVIVNRSGSLDSASSKENQSPVLVESPISVKSPAKIKPLHPNGAFGNSKLPIKPLSKQGLADNPVSKSGIEEIIRGEKQVDTEIEEIEKEISRLSSRLQVLRLEKADQNGRMSEKRGRVVPARFMEQKENVKNTTEELKKSEENLQLSAKAKVLRRAVSMGPGEIFSGACKGLSLGPPEIIAGGKPHQLGKLEITPVQPVQSRRKSCFWKLRDINEEKVTKERGRSLGPKSRKALCMTQGTRQAATTVGSRKDVKKEDGVLASIQPNKLFRDGEKSVAAKKSLKPGKVIACRYNQSTIQSALRKRSLPENVVDADESKRCDKKRASLVGKLHRNLPEMCRNQGTESRVKKRWEVPSEIVVCRNLEAEKSPPSISVVPDLLPRIRTAWFAIDTPRDSGPAKRVAELIGKKSYFCNGEDVEPSVCQALSFAEEDFEEEVNEN